MFLVGALRRRRRRRRITHPIHSNHTQWYLITDFVPVSFIFFGFFWSKLKKESFCSFYLTKKPYIILDFVLPIALKQRNSSETKRELFKLGSVFFCCCCSNIINIYCSQNSIHISFLCVYPLLLAINFDLLIGFFMFVSIYVYFE